MIGMSAETRGPAGITSVTDVDVDSFSSTPLPERSPCRPTSAALDAESRRGVPSTRLSYSNKSWHIYQPSAAKSDEQRAGAASRSPSPRFMRAASASYAEARYRSTMATTYRVPGRRPSASTPSRSTTRSRTARRSRSSPARSPPPTAPTARTSLPAGRPGLRGDAARPPAVGLDEARASPTTACCCSTSAAPAARRRSATSPATRRGAGRRT